MTAVDAVRVLASYGETLAVCESLTGGGIGAAITAVPGSSAVFVGGLIAYATRLKADLLGIDPAEIERVGVVSDETVRCMAEGVRLVCGADWGLAVTGVAGPDPVDDWQTGTVFVAVSGRAGAAGVTVRVCHFAGDRAAIRSQTVEEALRLLTECAGRE